MGNGVGKFMYRIDASAYASAVISSVSQTLVHEEVDDSGSKSSLRLKCTSVENEQEHIVLTYGTNVTRTRTDDLLNVPVDFPLTDRSWCGPAKSPNLVTTQIRHQDLGVVLISLQSSRLSSSG